MQRIKENLWVLLVLFFIAMLGVMYKIVDAPEAVEVLNEEHAREPISDVWENVDIEPDMEAIEIPNMAVTEIPDLPGMDVPEEIRAAAEQIGHMYNIQPEFIIAVCYVESQYNRNAVNKAGTCHGLMQVYTKFHLDRMARLGVTDIYSVYGNILVATDYLAELFDKYEDPATVLMVYNGDSKAMDWDYFSGYAEDVLTLAANLERAAGK